MKKIKILFAATFAIAVLSAFAIKPSTKSTIVYRQKLGSGSCSTTICNENLGTICNATNVKYYKALDTDNDQCVNQVTLHRQP